VFLAIQPSGSLAADRGQADLGALAVLGVVRSDVAIENLAVERPRLVGQPASDRGVGDVEREARDAGCRGDASGRSAYQ
jgi:hypothetical protein